MSAYIKYTVRMRGELDISNGETVAVPILSFEATYPLNGIPRASVVVAAGRTLGKTGEFDVPSPAHLKLDFVKYRTPARVYAHLIEEAGVKAGAGLVNEAPFPAHEFLIFEGYTSDQGYARGVAQVGFTLQLEHWLVALTFSSAVSASSHPANPYDLLFPATARLSSPDTPEGRNASGGLSGLGAAQAELGVDAIDDLWGNGILKWYRKLAERDHLLDAAIGGQLQLVVGLNGQAERPNRVANDVLDRMEPGDDMPPLALDMTDASAALIAENVRREIAARTIDSAAGQTLWDNLMDLGGRYLFAVSPGIERARVVPFTPALRAPYMTVYPTEIDTLERHTVTPVQTRAMVLYGVFSADAGGSLADGDAPSTIGPGGVYRPDDGDQGTVRMLPAPSWLANVAQQAFGRAGGATSDALVRNAGPNPAGNGATPPAGVEEAMGGLKPALDRFAHAAYLNDLTGFRTGTLIGKFRTDIAPGSIVRILPLPEKFLAEDDGGKPLFAAVTAVTLRLGSDPAPAAATILSLAHVRDRPENNLDRFTADRHPLYKTVWTGGRLDEGD